MSSNQHCEILKNSEQNVGFVTEKRRLSMFSEICSELNLSIMNIDESKMMFTFSTVVYSFLNNNINDILDKLVPTGIAQYLMDRNTKDFFVKDEKIMEKNVKILKLEDIKCLIILWTILTGISIILFVLEYSIAAVKEILINLMRNCYSNFRF